MAIDLSGLFLFDVEIVVEGMGFKVSSSSLYCIQDTLSLPAPIFTYTLTEGCVWVNPYGTDLHLLAERMANTWESQGYKVKRVIKGKTIQSFVLG